MRSIGVHRTTHTTLGSDTVSHNQAFSVQREMARQHVRNNMIKKTGNLDSSQRTAIVSSDLKSLLRTDYSNPNQNTVKSALARVRNSGCVPPKKKGAPH
jgi:hypothetical protein